MTWSADDGYAAATDYASASIGPATVVGIIDVYQDRVRRKDEDRRQAIEKYHKAATGAAELRRFLDDLVALLKDRGESTVQQLDEKLAEYDRRFVNPPVPSTFFVPPDATVRFFDENGEELP